MVHAIAELRKSLDEASKYRTATSFEGRISPFQIMPIYSWKSRGWNTLSVRLPNPPLPFPPPRDAVGPEGKRGNKFSRAPCARGLLFLIW